MGSRTRQPQGLSVSNGQRRASPVVDDFVHPNPVQRTGPPSFLNTRQRAGGITTALQASPQPQNYMNYMGALNSSAQPGVTYNTQMQQQLASNSAQSQAPIGSSFVDALDRQQGVSYNVDLQKRMANASAISQGLPPPFPGY